MQQSKKTGKNVVTNMQHKNLWDQTEMSSAPAHLGLPGHNWQYWAVEKKNVLDAY